MALILKETLKDCEKDHFEVFYNRPGKSWLKHERIQ